MNALLRSLVTLGEKVFWTYVEAILAILVVTDMGSDGWWAWQTMAIAALPAALTVLANGLPAPPTEGPFTGLLAYRIVRTFTVVFIGFLLAAPTFSLSIEASTAAAGAGWAAVFVVLKGLVAERIGARTPALLPANLDTAT